MNDTNFLQNTQDKYICGQYDNKLGVCDWLTVDVQFDQKEERVPKQLMSVNLNIINNNVNYVN